MNLCIEHFQFFPEANEVQFARESVFGGTSLKLDYLTKPSFFQDFGFVEKVKMLDRVKKEDELFVAGYPYFNVDGRRKLFMFLLYIVQQSNINFLFTPTFSFNFLLTPRNACGGRALQRSCGEYRTTTDYIQWGT